LTVLVEKGLIVEMHLVLELLVLVLQVIPLWEEMFIHCTTNRPFHRTPIELILVAEGWRLSGGIGQIVEDGRDITCVHWLMV